MVGFDLGRPVRVRIKHDLLVGRITGWWEDAYGKGPMVMLPSGRTIDIDAKRITRFDDTDELPIWEERECSLI
jgi:hypothetical protein